MSNYCMSDQMNKPMGNHPRWAIEGGAIWERSCMCGQLSASLPVDFFYTVARPQLIQYSMYSTIKLSAPYSYAHTVICPHSCSRFQSPSRQAVRPYKYSPGQLCRQLYGQLATFRAMVVH